MAEKEIIIAEKLDYSGLLKFSDFYQYAHTWFSEESYGVTEEKYSEKITGNSKEIDIEWKASKQISDYFKLEQKIKFEIKSLVEVEVEIDGKKAKMQQGKVRVDIKGALVKDVKSAWDPKPMLRFLRDVYDKYIIPQKVDAMEDKIKADVKDFKEEMKSFLDLSGKR
jgi:hypothetical protein